MDTRGVEIEGSRLSIGDLRRNRTETLADLLAIFGIIMTAISPFLWVFPMYNGRMDSFLFNFDIMIIMQYLTYLGIILFVLGAVLIVRISMRSFHARSRTALPVFGGVLLILGGVYTAFVYPLGWLIGALNGTTVSSDPLWMILALAIIVISIIAGILALKRRQWSLVLIACSATFIMASIFGLLAIIPIALSKSEFAQE